MKIPDKVLYVLIGLALLMAVAVDFISSMMSILSDLFFISLAIYGLWIVHKNSKEKDNKED